MATAVQGFTCGVLFSWFLSWFGIDDVFIDIFQPFVEATLTTSYFYFVFGIIGMFYCIWSDYKQKIIHGIIDFCTVPGGHGIYRINPALLGMTIGIGIALFIKILEHVLV